MWAIIILTSCFSCSKELELPDIPNNEKLVLIAELVANDSIYVRAGQSVPVSKNNEPVKFSQLDNINVQVSENNSTILLNERFEAPGSGAYTAPFSAADIIKGGAQYTVTAIHPDLENVAATIRVPNEFKAKVIDTMGVIYSSSKALQADILIEDNVNEENFYVVEVLKQYIDVRREFYHNGQWLNYDVAANNILYHSLVNDGVNVTKRADTTYYKSFTRQGISSDDGNTENFKDGDAYALNKRILLKDAVFTGGTYNLRIVVRRTVLEEDNGLVHILVKSVPKEYFDFLKAYEQYDPSISYNTFTAQVILKGNVQNGLGMVGAAYQQRFSYWVGDWSF